MNRRELLDADLIQLCHWDCDQRVTVASERKCIYCEAREEIALLRMVLVEAAIPLEVLRADSAAGAEYIAPSVEDSMNTVLARIHDLLPTLGNRKPHDRPRAAGAHP